MRVLLVASLIAVASATAWFLENRRIIPDDAKIAGKTPADFPQTMSHSFDDMDGGIALSEDEIKGRNTWLFWTAGDQVFWDRVARFGLGAGDLLRTIDSRRRGSRFRDIGVINEPGYRQAEAPDSYGLWIDEATSDVEKDLNPAVYGRSTGIIGLRLFPNPDFNAEAQKSWNAERYYRDFQFASDPNLVRPYRIGMSCGFCHVAFNPLRPPADPEVPAWSNLSSTIGNQYINASAVFAAGVPPSSYVFQLLSSWQRGTIDTSFLASDNINNPSNINALYDLPERLAASHEETVAGGALHLPGTRRSMPVAHILKDGADSVGLFGALSRVYVSIGTYSQEWLRDHNLMVGGSPQRPFDVARAQRGSIYWQATTERLPNLAAFLQRMRSPRLADAPNGNAYLSHDSVMLARGRRIFAEQCARCHSSKQPQEKLALSPSEYAEWMQQELQKPEFLDSNFFSTDARIPVSTVSTNAARALASNATRGHVWDNFSSETYKTLPSAGAIEVQNPFDGTKSRFMLPEGGRGYYRVPSLRAAWATAPFFHNNALGTFTGDPSVAGRVAAFNDAMQRLLWPEKRLGAASISRTSEETYIQVPRVYVPAPFVSATDGNLLSVGPLPNGTPIDLIANLDLNLSDEKKVERVRLLLKAQQVLSRIRREHLDEEQATEVMKTLAPDLLKLSNCPDFVQDGGHFFGTKLPDDDKRALIEFLKTL